MAPESAATSRQSHRLKSASTLPEGPAANFMDASTPPASAMASTLDLFILTFNCAKNFVNVPVFATHLHTALKQNAPTPALPDVVVFSLQEASPLSYAFIGPYFLDPYLARYEEALNLAADKFVSSDTSVQDEEDAASVRETPLPAPRRRPYTLVRKKNIGITVVMLFALDPGAITSVQEAEIGFGAAEMGNKGAVGLRIAYESSDHKSTELTFVATHLAAMEWNLPRRNANWATIMRGLTFENPEDVLRQRKPLKKGDAEEGPAEVDEQQVHLLEDHHHEQSLLLQERLHNISVFKPSSHLFVAGDLNYRISASAPPPLATFPSLDPESEHFYQHFFPLDQLTRERRAGRTLHGLAEADVTFPPTYKYVVLPSDGAGSDTELEVPWIFAPHRYPSWTDRILYLDIPPWAKTADSKDRNMDVRAYDALPLLRCSDHRPVFLRVGVPLLGADTMTPPSSAPERDSGEWATDPRVKLPVEIDPEAWERRAAARRREVMAGWSMFLWSTQQGALVLGTILMIGVGGWWAFRGW